MTSYPKRTKSFEAKLFEKFGDDVLLESAEKVMSGQIKNVPQLNFIQDIFKRKLEKEKQEGHIDIDYMSLVDVGREALRDEVFCETMGKALNQKKLMSKGKDLESTKFYDNFAETVDKAVSDRELSKHDVKSKTRHLLSGDFDKELESEDVDNSGVGEQPDSAVPVEGGVSEGDE